MIYKFDLTILSYMQLVDINHLNYIYPTFVYLCKQLSNKNQILTTNSFVEDEESDNMFFIDSDEDKPDRPMTEQEIENNLIKKSGLMSDSGSDDEEDTNKSQTLLIKRKKKSTRDIFDICFMNTIYSPLLPDHVRKTISTSIRQMSLKPNKFIPDVLLEHVSTLMIVYDPDRLIPVMVGTMKNLNFPFRISCRYVGSEDVIIMNTVLKLCKFKCTHVSEMNPNDIGMIPYTTPSGQFYNLTSVRDLSVITNPRSWELKAREVSWLDYHVLYKEFDILSHNHILRLSQLDDIQLFSESVYTCPITMLFPLHGIYHHFFLRRVLSYITNDCIDPVGWIKYNQWSKQFGLHKYYTLNDTKLLSRPMIVKTCQSQMKKYNQGVDIRDWLSELKDVDMKRIMCPVIRIYDIVKTFLETQNGPRFTFQTDPRQSFIDISCHMIIDRSRPNMIRPTWVMDRKYMVPKKSWFCDDHPLVSDSIPNRSNISYRLIVTNMTDDIMLINTLWFIFNKIRPVNKLHVECLYIKDSDTSLIRKRLVARGFCWRMFFENCFPTFIDYSISIQRRVFVNDIVYVPELNIVSKVIEVYRRLYDDPSVLNSIRLGITPVLLPKIKHRFATNGHRYEYIQLLEVNNNTKKTDHSLCCGLSCKKKIILSLYSHIVFTL